MFVHVTPDTHWLLKRIEMILGFWETQDDESAKMYAISYLGELKDYLTSLDGNYHAAAVLNRENGIPRINMESGIADSCGSEIL